MIVTLVTAVAEPYLEHALPIFSPNGSTHRVLVIDSSYSMAYKAGGRSRFEQAKQWAARIVEHSPPGDGFTLVQMASPPRVIVATPGMEAGTDPPGNPEPGTAAHRGRSGRHAGRGPQGAGHGPPRQPPPHAARSLFLHRPAAGNLAAGDERCGQGATFQQPRRPELAALAELQVINLGQPGDDNLAVTSLDLRDPMVLVGRSVALEAGVRDFGHVAGSSRPSICWSMAVRRAGSTSTFPPAAARSCDSIIASNRAATMPWKSGSRATR